MPASARALMQKHDDTYVAVRRGRNLPNNGDRCRYCEDDWLVYAVSPIARLLVTDALGEMLGELTEPRR